MRKKSETSPADEHSTVMKRRKYARHPLPAIVPDGLQLEVKIGMLFLPSYAKDAAERSLLRQLGMRSLVRLPPPRGRLSHYLQQIEQH